MMLTLNDGRSELWQWDTGRTLAVDADCSQVHFSNKFFGRSIDVDVVDGAAIIPDILLQTDKDLNVWAFVGTAENGYTKISKTFKVNRRNKPADYVFTPTDQTTLAELSGRLDRIEESQGPDAIKNAVEDYLEQNPVEIPVQSVNGQTGAVELTADDVGAIADETDPTVPDWAKQPTKPSYTAEEVGARSSDWMPTAAEVGALPTTYTPPDQTAEQVGADPAGTAASAVSQHNTDATAHNDLRLSLQGLSDRINVALDSDDATLDQMSEVVAYIKSNKSLIDAITTSKVSVADIVNDLATNMTDKPLSAAQGVVLKGLIDALSNYKLDAAELTNAVNTALAQAKASGEFDGADGKSAYAYAVDGGYTGTEAEFAAKLAAEKFANPNALTFTGAVTGSYDGSAPLSVEIPSGGGSSSGGYVDTIIADIEITEEVNTYHTSTLTRDQVEALKNADIIYFCANLAKPSAQTGRGNLLASIYGSYYHATKFFYNDSGYANVTPSSSAHGGDIAESILLKNSASGNYFQWIRWKNTDNQYGGEAGNSARTSITIPDGSIFNLSTNTVFGVGTTAKLIARRFL